MLSQEDIVLLASLSLSEKERGGSVYQKEMKHVAAGLNNLALASIRRIDVREPAERCGRLIWFEVKGLESLIPLDIAFLDQLRADWRAETLAAIVPIKGSLSSEVRLIIRRLEIIDVMACLIDFNHLNLETILEETLDRLQGHELEALGPSRQRDLLEECRLTAVRTNIMLELVATSVEDNTHPQHTRAKKWLGAAHYHGDALLFRKELDHALERLMASWAKLCNRVEGVRASTLEPDPTTWFDLGEPINAVLEGDAPGITDYRSLIANHSPRYYEARRRRIRQDRFKPEKYLTDLADLFMELEQKLYQALKSGGPLFTALEFERRSGSMTSWQYKEECLGLEDHWVGLYWLYLEVFQELVELRPAHSQIPLPAAVDNRLDQGASEKTIKTILADSSLDALEAGLEDMELDEEFNFNRLMIHYRQWQRQLLQMAPGKHRLGSVSGYDNRGIKAVWEELHRFYSHFKRFDRLGNRLEHLILEAFESLNNWNDPDPLYRDLCLQLKERDLAKSAVSGNIRGLRAAKTQEALELAIREPDDIVTRLTMISTLLNKFPGLENSRAADENDEKVRAFWLQNSLDITIQALRVKAELRENLDGSEPRKARLEAFGLTICDAEIYQSRLDGIGEEAEYLCRETDMEQTLAGITNLEEALVQAQRICVEGSSAHRKLSFIMARNLIDEELGRTLENDLEHCYRELIMVQEDAGSLKEQIRKAQERLTGHKTLSRPVLNLTDINNLRQSWRLLEQLPLAVLEELAGLNLQHQIMIADLFEKARAGDVIIDPGIRSAISERIYRAFKANGTISNMLRLCLLQHAPELALLESQLLALLLELTPPQQLERQKLVMEVMEMYRLIERGPKQSEQGLETLYKKSQQWLDDYQPVYFPRNYETNWDFLSQWFQRLFAGTFV